MECALLSDLKNTQAHAHCLFPRYRYMQSLSLPNPLTLLTSIRPSLTYKPGRESDLLTGDEPIPRES